MQQALLFFVLEYDDVSVSSLDELSVFAVERVHLIRPALALLEHAAPELL